MGGKKTRVRAEEAKVAKRRIARRVVMVVAAAVVVGAAIAAAHSFRESVREKEIDAIVATLSDHTQREKAAEELGGVTDSTGIRRIVWHLGDEDPRVRDEIVEVIGKIGAGAVEPLADAMRRSYRRSPAWTRRSPTLRWVYGQWRRAFPGNGYERWGQYARAWLPEAFGKIGAPARGALIAMVSDTDTYMRTDALWALERIADPRDLDLFISYLGYYRYSPMAAANAAAGLGEIKGAREGRREADLAGDDAAWREFDARSGEAVGALVASLTCPEAQVRRSAAFALGNYRDSAAAVDAVLAVVRDAQEMAMVRVAAVEGLDHAESPGVRETLFGVLGDSDPDVRGAAVSSLLYDRDSGTARRVAELLGSSDSFVRESAVSFFTGSWEERNVLFLAEAYKGLDEAGKRNAIAALERIRDGAFAEGRKEPEAVKTRTRLQQAAEEALKKIGGEAPGSEELRDEGGSPRADKPSTGGQAPGAGK